MLTVTEGLVLREVMYKDADKMLTILTRDLGKVSASCPGARSRQSQTRAGTQLLTCSNFTLYESRGRYSVNSADPLEHFTGLRTDIMALSLGSYFAEVLDAVSDTGAPASELLSMGLNCLYALATKKKLRAQIKAAFELRVMLLSGYAPNLFECEVCGQDNATELFLHSKKGHITCCECGDDMTGTVPISREALQAAKYILLSEPKKFLSFGISTEAIESLSVAVEQYLLCQVDRSFPTLDFYKSLEHM